MIPVVLRTERLLLDQPTLADVDPMAEYCRDPVFEEFMLLGMIGYRSPTGDLGYWLGAPHRGRGVTFIGTGPSALSPRDGSTAEAWHATLAATDSRAPKDG
jgi:RimJ/RimL family protein N-acetyltransferase